jgi:urease accessory protein
MSVRIAAGGRFAWLPEPLVAAAGCYHRMESIVELDEGGELLWRDELVVGRYREEPGRLRQDTRIRYAGTTVLSQDLALGPESEWAAPAVLGGSRVTGNLVIVSTVWDPPPSAVAVAGAARMPLAGPAVMCAGVADDVPTLRRTLTELAPPAWLPMPG